MPRRSPRVRGEGGVTPASRPPCATNAAAPFNTPSCPSSSPSNRSLKHPHRLPITLRPQPKPLSPGVSSPGSGPCAILLDRDQRPLISSQSPTRCLHAATTRCALKPSQLPISSLQTHARLPIIHTTVGDALVGSTPCRRGCSGSSTTRPNMS